MTFEIATVGARIRFLRKRTGLTQQELGDLLGVSGSLVGQYENGTRNPKYETLTKIARALDGDINWLRNGYTMEERDATMKDAVSRTYTTADIRQRMEKLNVAGLIKIADYVNLLILSGLYERQDEPRGTKVTVYGDGPAGNFPPKPKEEDT